MQTFLVNVSQGLFAIVLANVILFLTAAGMGAIILGGVKVGRYYLLKCRRALQKPEYLVLRQSKLAKHFSLKLVNNEKHAEKKKVKNGKAA